MTGALAFVATADLVAMCRGRAFRAEELEHRARSGTGWVPANLALTPFGSIVEPNVFGPVGDLRLLPDLSTLTVLPASGSRPPLHLVLADQTETDGTPWACCPRTFCRQAGEALHQATGLTVHAAFEHEFVLLPGDGDGTAPATRPAPGPFSLGSHRDAEPLASAIMAALDAAGLEPETWLPEYGSRQYEVTLRPAGALVAADRALLLREIVRDVACAMGRRVTFAPVPQPGGVGNGVHVHLSLVDGRGDPVMYDAGRPGRLSVEAGGFAAGVLAHAEVLTALTAPSPVSWSRLAPHRWSAGGIYLGNRNREALLRICPTVEVDGRDPAPQLHLEYRAADATANPWLVLGALVHAGLDGIRRALPAPPVVDADVDGLTGADRAALGIRPLPADLGSALEALRGDDAARSWLPPDLLATFLAVKDDELRLAEEDGDPGVTCARYVDVY